MTINLTPDIQSQIYMDKKDGYLISMVEKLTPKMEYEPKKLGKAMKFFPVVGIIIGVILY